MAEAEVESRQRLAELLSAKLPSDWPPPLNDEASARWILDYLTRHPEEAGWVAWYFIFAEGDGGTAIGNGGFKGKPIDGTVEIGYSIVPEFQRRGFASEALDALLGWAFDHPEVQRVVAETLPELVASQALLRKLKFQPIVPAGNDPGLLRFERTRAVES